MAILTSWGEHQSTTSDGAQALSRGRRTVVGGHCRPRGPGLWRSVLHCPRRRPHLHRRGPARAAVAVAPVDLRPISRTTSWPASRSPGIDPLAAVTDGDVLALQVGAVVLLLAAALAAALLRRGEGSAADPAAGQAVTA